MMTMTVDDHLCPVLRSPPLPFRSHRGRYNGIHQVVLGNRYGTAKPSTPVRFWAPPPTKVLVNGLDTLLDSQLPLAIGARMARLWWMEGDGLGLACTPRLRDDAREVLSVRSVSLGGRVLVDERGPRR